MERGPALSADSRDVVDAIGAALRRLARVAAELGACDLAEELGAASLAGKLDGLTGEHGCAALLDVPSNPIRGAVPCDSCGLRGLDVSPRSLSASRSRRVLAEMLGPVDHLKVPDRVVERVAIDVVDVEAIRDGAVGLHPDRSVQVLGIRDPSSLDRAYEVDPRRPVIGVGIAPVSTAIERDSFALSVFAHKKTVSDCVSDAKGFHPRAVSIGWSGVPMTEPVSVVSRHVSLMPDENDASTGRGPTLVIAMSPTRTSEIRTGPVGVSIMVEPMKQQWSPCTTPFT